MITFFGMIPNFEPQDILPKLAKLIRRQDTLLFSANLAPGADYAVGVKADDAFGTARAETEAMIRDIEALLPGVEPVIATSEFGDEALKKARQAIERARQAIDSRSTEAVQTAREPLERTLKMLRGVSQKMGGA